MSILSCQNFSVDVSGEALFRNISFAVEKGEKVGLVGTNGAGKSTLVKACLGEWPLESGQITLSGSWGYLPQTPDLKDKGTVFQSMLVERSDLLRMRSQLSLLEAKMSGNPEGRILEDYSLLTEKYEREGGYALEAQVRKILAGLGLVQESSHDVSRLSGGQKTRLALSKLLLRAPDLLVLDEPTNHLDIEAIEWLEGFLKEYTGAVLVISHDRYFLDQIVGKILHLGNGCLKSYSGNFSEFELQRVLEEKTLAKEAERQAQRIARLEEYVRSNKAGINAKQARGREIMLRKITPIETGRKERSLAIAAQSVPRSGDRALDVQELSVGYGPKILFWHLNLSLRRGEKVALLGKNGIGKTSLLKAITGEIPYQGIIRLGTNVKLAYYSQEHEGLDQTGTVIDEIRHNSGLNDPEIRSLLARYGFEGEDVFKPVRVLSGGEKSRLALCKLFLTKGNFLLLDEPTNHLDIETRSVLEEALTEYEGTVLTVSHDRYFLDKFIEKIVTLTPDGLNVYEGDYSSWREQKQTIPTGPINPNNDSGPQTKAQESREAVKNEQRRQRKIGQIEQEISELEKNLYDLEQELEQAGADYAKVLELHKACENVKTRLDKALENWIEVSN